MWAALARLAPMVLRGGAAAEGGAAASGGSNLSKMFVNYAQTKASSLGSGQSQQPKPQRQPGEGYGPWIKNG